MSDTTFAWGLGDHRRDESQTKRRRTAPSEHDQLQPTGSIRRKDSLQLPLSTVAALAKDLNLMEALVLSPNEMEARRHGQSPLAPTQRSMRPHPLAQGCPFWARRRSLASCVPRRKAAAALSSCMLETPIPLLLYHPQALENDLFCTPAAPSTTNAAGNYHGGTPSPLATTTADRTAPRWPEAHSALITPSSSRASHPVLEALENDFGCTPSEVTALEKDLSLRKAPVSALYTLDTDLSSSLEAAAEPENHAASWQAAMREVLSRGDLAENNHRLLAPISKCATCVAFDTWLFLMRARCHTTPHLWP